MNRVFVGKLETTQPVLDNEGHLHAPPIHPGMPPPTISSPREDADWGVTTASAGSSRGLFGTLFGTKPAGQPGTAPGQSSPSQAQPSQTQPNQVASNDGGGQNQTSLFGNLFKPKAEAPAPPPPVVAQGTALAGISRPAVADGQGGCVQSRAQSRGNRRRRAATERNEDASSATPRRKQRRRQQ